MGRPNATRWRLAQLSGVCVLVVPALAFTQGSTQIPPPPPPPTLPRPAVVVEGRVMTFRPPRRLADLTMPIPADNALTDAKSALGRRLFFDPQLSTDRSVSCATCHDPERAFADARPLAVGVFGRVGRRHSPALINRGYGRSHFWDGRAATLEMQVTQPIEDPSEMASTLDEVVTRLNTDVSYRDDFQAAFDRPLSAADVARALASYLRTVRSSDSPYDRFIDGAHDALSPEAQSGLRIFRTKARCTFCHVEPTFSDEQFHNTGVAWKGTADGSGAFQDDGRLAVTRAERDRGAFKTPTLREVARTAPYMHDGSLQTLAEVIEFYNQGGRPNPALTHLIRPIGLTEEDKQALVKFLESLNGVVSGK